MTLQSRSSLARPVRAIGGNSRSDATTQENAFAEVRRLLDGRHRQLLILTLLFKSAISVGAVAKKFAVSLLLTHLSSETALIKEICPVKKTVSSNKPFRLYSVVAPGDSTHQAVDA